jgi:hypothetical protein
VRIWKVLLIAAMVIGLAGVIVGAAALARGGGARQRVEPWGPGMMLQRGAGASARQGVPGGMMRGWSNGQPSDEMVKLMQEHAGDMAAWWQKYGQDPASPEAQKALQQLRSEHRSDMQQLRGHASGSASPGPGPVPYGPGMMGGGAAGGGMMDDW